ncbi:MAG: CapA family protein, partial [Acutalibacteraceae bacterium]|nr:CapA family protein [Acutalibacteraceae bacterium]
MAKKRTKRQQAIIKRRIFLSCCTVVLAAVIALVAFTVGVIVKKDGDKTGGKKEESKTSETSSITVPETTATVLSTGDIMVHSTQLTGAKTASGEYDFSAFFKESGSYFNAVDLSVANLEVTFGGTES